MFNQNRSPGPSPTKKTNTPCPVENRTAPIIPKSPPPAALKRKGHGGGRNHAADPKSTNDYVKKPSGMSGAQRKGTEAMLVALQWGLAHGKHGRHGMGFLVQWFVVQWDSVNSVGNEACWVWWGLSAAATLCECRGWRGGFGVRWDLRQPSRSADRRSQSETARRWKGGLSLTRRSLRRAGADNGTANGRLSLA